MTDLWLPVTPETLARSGLMIVGFVAAQFLGTRLLPGVHRRGFPTPSGQALTYKLNGLVLFLLTPVVILLGTALWGWSLTVVLSHFWSLFIVANVAAVLVVLWLFVRGRRSEGRDLERQSKLPPVLHDLWLGVELNPKLLGVDLKMFAYQPSLIGLFVMVMAFAYRQHELTGELTPQMILFVGFWWAYLFTHYVRESFMLSTWDVIAEKFGFMLVWGDAVYVPFFYSICGWYLIDYRPDWPLWALLGLVVLHGVGHTVFRGANWQKDRFKRDPSAPIWGKPAETLGGRLLVSGWWGIGRKINYTGELLVYLSFALCTGFQSWVPYLLPLSLTVLLTQRAARDDKRCRAKYGQLWEDYCRRARFRIFPYVY